MILQTALEYYKTRCEVTEKEIAGAVFAINQDKSLESVGMNA